MAYPRVRAQDIYYNHYQEGQRSFDEEEGT